MIQTRIVFARVVVTACALVCAHGPRALADSSSSEVVPRTAEAPALGAGATLLVPTTGRWRWQLVTAPRLAPQLGALAVSGLDAVAGRAAITPVLGEPVPEPAGWPYAVAADASTIPAAPDDRRIAAAFGVTTFALGDAHQGLEVLELRLQYRDGIAVWLNGLEIVRRALPRGGPMGLAARPHGPEWETFHVAVAPGLLRHGANVLAVEAHPSGRLDAPEVTLELAGRRDRGILRGPILADVGATAAAIVIETDAGVDATLEWGLGDALDRRMASPPGRHHRFTLANLPPNADVSYRVIAGASRSARYAFHTLPGPGALVRVGVYGDVRGGHAIHQQLVGQMLREGLDLVGVTGDMVLRGTDEADWQRFFAVTRDLLAQVPYLPAIGNHDLGWNGASGERAEAFALPPGPADRPLGTYWYSRDIADVHLVFLDSNAYARSEQEIWLEADLAAARARGARAILVFTHDGPYARGYHGGSSIARDRYVPILAKHRVDLVLSGHDHIYQRGEIDGLRYLVAGGGGAPMYGIRCGIKGRPKCSVDDGMQAIGREHHYVVLTIGRDLEMCARKPDGTLVERCLRWALRNDR